ncbi:hypothetical protein ABZ747_17675 [Kitasatospora cineracea]|uniref:hypothetical protein n=1 Tax=Kitasatospora cineracea TaxID=88074 RepID=UPI00340AFB17
MPADHRRKAEIAARMAATGESRREAAWAVANPDKVPVYVECTGWSTCPGCLECADDPVSMCYECSYVFVGHEFEPEDGSCPNGCTDYREARDGRRLNEARLAALGPVPQPDRPA